MISRAEGWPRTKDIAGRSSDGRNNNDSRARAAALVVVLSDPGLGRPQKSDTNPSWWRTHNVTDDTWLKIKSGQWSPITMGDCP